MGLILFEHHFRGFDDRGDLVSDLQLHLLNAALGDYAFNHILADTDHHMRHDATELNLDHFAFEPVSCGKGHGQKHTPVPAAPSSATVFSSISESLETV